MNVLSSMDRTSIALWLARVRGKPLVFLRRYFPLPLSLTLRWTTRQTIPIYCKAGLKENSRRSTWRHLSAKKKRHFQCRPFSYVIHVLSGEKLFLENSSTKRVILRNSNVDEIYTEMSSFNHTRYRVEFYSCNLYQNYGVHLFLSFYIICKRNSWNIFSNIFISHNDEWK